MHLLHLSDLHLGVEAYGRVDPATGLSTRLLDALAALDQAVDFALKNEVDLFLFCGDAYKSRDPSQTQQRELAARIGRLAAAGIQVFLVPGNHDTPAAPSRANTVDIFHTLAIDNVHVAHRPGTHLLQLKSGPLQVVALPWARRASLLSREETKGLTLEQLDEELRQRLTRWLQEELEGLDGGIPAVLAGHVAVDSAKLGSERIMMLGRDYVLLKSSLLHPKLDYVALGHVHRHQALSATPPLVYSGSLLAVDFSDEGQEKGFCLVEIDPARPPGERASWGFQPVASRRFLTIEARALPPDPTQAVLRAIARHDVEGAIVRLHIQVAAGEDHLIDEAALRQALAPAHYIAAIYREVEGRARPRLGGLGERGLAPLEALGLYLKGRGLSGERASQLLEYGERLIQEAQAGP